jgi:hypothetical protein
LKIQYEYSFFNNCYYILIIYNNKTIKTDNEISNLLNIKYNKYIDLLMLYNAKKDGNEYYFETKEDCEKIIKKIKQKYNDKLIYLKLTENK